jgi:hypothetical protein
MWMSNRPGPSLLQWNTVWIEILFQISEDDARIWTGPAPRRRFAMGNLSRP